MTSDPIDVQGAKWLIFYFKKGWSMCGLRKQLETLDADISKFPFMPSDAWWYFRKGCSVRGFVAQNYPKLNDFLTDAPVEKQIKAAEQIVKLRPKVARSQGALTPKEREEIRATRIKMMQATTSYRLSREVFKSAQGHEWNTCK